MHAYLATICRDLGADFVHVGGVSEHVHIVTTLPRTLSQAQFVEQIEKTSSKWMKGVDARYRGFFWEKGYAAFFGEPKSARCGAGIRRYTTIRFLGRCPRLALNSAFGASAQIAIKVEPASYMVAWFEVFARQAAKDI